MPLIDRDKQLKSAIDCAFRALALGEAQVLNLVGERGMGKSALTNEILRRVAAAPFPELRVLRAGPSRAGAGEAMEQLLLACFREDCDKDDVKARQRLRNALAGRSSAFGVAEAPFLVARVLSRAGSTTPLLRAVAENEPSVDAITDALLASIWEGLAVEKPLVLIIEDLQFCSQATIDMVRSLCHSLTGRVLLLVTSRTDELEGLAADPKRVCTLALPPLPPERCLEIVREHLQLTTSKAPAALVEACLQLSSVLPGGVSEALVELEARGAYRRTSNAEHPLECDDSRIGYVANLLIAEQAHKDGGLRAAARAYLAAGRCAISAGQPSWAITLATTALELLEGSPGLDRAFAYQQRGEASKLLGRTSEALAAFQHMALVASASDASELTAAAHAEIGRVQRDRGELTVARQHLELALSAFEALADKANIGVLHEDLARLDLLAGEYSRAQEHVVTALEMAAAADNQRLFGHCLAVLAAISLDAGNRAQAVSALELSLAVCQEQQDIRGVAEDIFQLGCLAQHENDHLRALELLFDAHDLAMEFDHFPRLPDVWIAIADSYQHRGDLNEATSSLAKAEALLAISKNKLSLAELRRVEAKIHLRAGDLPGARLAADAAVSLYGQVHSPARLAAALRTLGETLAAEPMRDDEQVSRCFMEAIGLSKDIGNQDEIAKSYHAFASFALRAPEYRQHERIHSEAEKLHSFATAIFKSQRVGLSPSAWFQLRLAGLSINAPKPVAREATPKFDHSVLVSGSALPTLRVPAG